MTTEPLISTPEAAELLGVPERYFTDMANSIGFEAAVPGTKTQPRLWHKADINAFGRGPYGQEMLETLARDAQVEAIVTSLDDTYPEWKTAIRPAADAMFQFNRYTKYASCTPNRRQELYGLKDHFMEALCSMDLCVGIREDVVEKDSDDDEEGVQEYLMFAFEIEGQRFSWHLPKHRVSWAYTLTPLPETTSTRPAWQPGLGPKPISLGTEEFILAEAHIRFILAKVEAEEEAATARRKQEYAAKMRAEGLARQKAMRGELQP
ncbi:MAG: hypothetical protein ACRC8S_04795 [Fimbriiglobus sp.]